MPAPSLKYADVAAVDALRDSLTMYCHGLYEEDIDQLFLKYRTLSYKPIYDYKQSLERAVELKSILIDMVGCRSSDDNVSLGLYIKILGGRNGWINKVVTHMNKEADDGLGFRRSAVVPPIEMVDKGVI